MFARIITGKVRKELEKMNFAYNGEILPLKVEDDVWTLRIFKINKSLVVKYFDIDNSALYVMKYLVMEKFGINMPVIIAKSDKLIIFADYLDGAKYERVNMECITNEQIIEISKLYKKIHSFFSDQFIDYKEYFTLSNIRKIMIKYNLVYNDGLKYICTHFNTFLSNIKGVESCLIMNGFPLENIVFLKESGKAILCKVDDLVNGYRGIDIACAREVLGEEKFEIFIQEYSKENYKEILVGEIVGKLLKLYLSMDDKYLSNECKKVLEDFVSLDFQNKIKNLIDWY